VSQCLPIFVQGVLQERGQLLVVEQPESQLHPTAQLELGGFFAALWTERQVPSIIETHSANLLLRIRKLIKKEELKSSDVSVAYFTVEDRKVVVRNLDIHADGSPDGVLRRGRNRSHRNGSLRCARLQ
jgi:predicted ATPase